MRILVIGQCTLHWGRMQYGNIGNFYIMDTFFSEIRRVFPNAEIATTMQFSRDFCEKYMIDTLPMGLYYNFEDDCNLEFAIAEYNAAVHDKEDTPYISEVKKSDLVIDFSGDIWGKNADFLGKDRFETGCYKDLTAQSLKPTVMIAGSPGPFKEESINLARRVYKGFNLVTNREPISTRLLYEQGFDTSNTYDYPCPSFAFVSAKGKALDDVVEKYDLDNKTKLKIGLIMCGWNFERGPFDEWPRNDCEYTHFSKFVKKIIKNNDCMFYLMSHSNGFDIPPKPFRLKQGRDFPIVEQLYNVLLADGCGDNVRLIEECYLPDMTKGIISKFDVLVSGRLHGAVAGISQGIPTVLIDYGHEPKAHKLKGFAEIAEVSDYICNPNDFQEMVSRTQKCLSDREMIKEKLSRIMPVVLKDISKQFDLIKELFEGIR